VSTFDDREENGTESEPDAAGIERGASESQAAYLIRAAELVSAGIREMTGGLLFDPYRVTEARLSAAAREQIARVAEMARGDAPAIADPTEMARTLEKIAAAVEIHSNSKTSLPDSEATFDETERRRRFFETRPGGRTAGRETYWNTLFFPYNTAATRSLAQDMLRDRTILLLGGGRARLGEELARYDITPARLLNVDPFVDQVEAGADPVIPVSAADAALAEKLNALVGQAAEIWAEYSVPAYLDSAAEIQRLFHNIDRLLAEGGHARIWPTAVKTGTPDEVNDRAAALMSSLEVLAGTGGYTITAFTAAGRPGFTLRKPSRPAE
jgi:hypothetical protein